MRIIFYIMVYSAFCSSALAENISLKDGDSFVLNGVDIRLWGIDAPEFKQTCFDEASLPYFCGEEAKKMLGKLIGKSAINCTTKSIDRYGRKVAQCEINGRDLGALMVLSGNAIDCEPLRAYARSIY